MDDSIGDLILAPFREIVAQGRKASGNADKASDHSMGTVAQNLVKEGERALKRLEPLCQKKYEDFGAAFVSSLKDDVEISRYTERLNDLLYDFEEFVEADHFDEAKFLELQACSRKAAPGISHRITRFKLLPRADEDPYSPLSPASLSEPTVLGRQTSDTISLQSGLSLPYPDDMGGEKQTKFAMPWPPAYEPEAQQRESPVPCLLPPVQEEESSSLDPWSQRSQDIEQGLELIAQRRDHSHYSDSAIGSEATSEHTSSPKFNDQPILSSIPAVPPRSPYRIITPPVQGPSFEQTASFIRSHYGRESVSPLSAQYNRESLASSANMSLQSSVSDHRSHEWDSYFDVVSPMTPTHQTSEYSLDSQFQELEQEQSRSPHVRPLFVQAHSSAEGLEPVAPPAPGMVPDGLMLVEEDSMQPVWPAAALEMQLGGCAISSHSSYYQFGGFCKGAMEIIQGGLGIKHIKKQGLAVGNIEVAKCNACAYELEWKAVEKDLNNEATENFKSEGIGFRLRFLSKSHIPSKIKDEQIYGCLLCVQLRRTTHPNDATVFFSERQLFAHLARHTRPLPHIPGLTVVQSEEIPCQFANNYDIHYWTQPGASDLTHEVRNLTTLPTATTLRTYRPSQVGKLKKPADGRELLCFAAGARILGIRFPEQYEGLWCVGWADHQYGLIPAEAIRLDPPMKDSVRDLGSSSMQAVARWRFAVKDIKDINGEEWLSFSKGEVLTNIGWSHQEHWCWSGTNCKGKSGLFPRSHIEPGSLVGMAAKSDTVSVASNEKKPGLLSRISIRHRSRSDGGGWCKETSSPRASIY